MDSMQEAFNVELLKTMSTSILQNSIFGWDGYGRVIFAVCFIVALFQSFTKDEKSMLVEWTKIVIASWFCLAILGQPQANWKKVFPFLGNAGSLDIAVFNYAKSTFDSIGKEMSKKEGGQATLAYYTLQLNTTLGRFVVATVKCSVSAGAYGDCVKKIMTASLLEDENKDEPTTTLGQIAKFLDDITAFWLTFQLNPFIILFPFFMIILNVIRGITEMVVLVGFGMITAIMLLLTKALCPLMLLPAYRDRIISLFKTTLSTSLYGFVSHLILWLSIVLTKALYKTTGVFFVDQLSGSMGLAAPGLMFLIITNFFTSFVILAMQVAAIAKIPKICKQIMNLSVEEIVNIGETLLQASIGAAKMAGMIGVGLASGGAALAAGGLSSVGAMAGQAGGKFGGMLNAAGSGLNKFNATAQRFGFDGIPVPGQGSSPASKLLGGNAGSGIAMGDANSGGGGGGGGGRGGSGDKALLDKNKKKGKIASSATDKPDAGSATLQGDEDDGEGGGSDKKSELTSLEEKKKNQGGILSVTDERERKKLSLLENTVGVAGTAMGGKGLKGVLSAVGSMAEDGFKAGLGSGDGLSWAGSLGKNLNDKKTKEAMGRAGQALGEKFKQPTKLEAGLAAEQAYNTMGVGQQEMNEETSAEFDELTSKMASGEFTDDDSLKLMRMNNMYKKTDEQTKKFNSSTSGNQDYWNMVEQEQNKNHSLSKAISDGTATDKQIMEYSQRVQSGMVDLYKGRRDNDTFKSLNNVAQKNISSTVSGIEQARAAREAAGQGHGLTKQERQQMNSIATHGSRAIMGDNATLDAMEKSSMGSMDLSHLRQDKNQSANLVTNYNTQMAQATAEAQTNNHVAFAKLNNDLEMAIDKDGNMMGFVINGRIVDSFDKIEKEKGSAGYDSLQQYMTAQDNYEENFEVRDEVEKHSRANRSMNTPNAVQLRDFVRNMKKS